MKAVFFDFDGVLTTDQKGSYTTCSNIAKAANMPLDEIIPCYRKYIQELNLGASHSEIWRGFCDCLGRDLDLSILKQAFLNTPRNERMFALAKKLRKNYKTGIITNNNKERFYLLKEAWNLGKLFDILILSADVGAMKDDRAIFEAALGSLDLKPEDCVFIDNSRKNLLVPEEMGFKTIFHDHEKNNVSTLVDRLKELGLCGI